MSLHKLRVLTALLAAPLPAKPSLAYSDYFFIAAIITGLIGSSTFFGGLSSATINGATITGFCVLLTTIFTAVGKYLLSKGD